MKKRLVILGLVILLALAIVTPVLANPVNACHAEQLHGLFGQFAPPVELTLDTAFFPVAGFDDTTVLVVLRSGTTVVLDYDEGLNYFPGFQCTTEPPGGAGLPTDDTVVQVFALPPGP